MLQAVLDESNQTSIPSRLVDNAIRAIADLDRNTVDKRAAKRTLVAGMVDETMVEDKCLSKVAGILKVSRRFAKAAVEHRMSALTSSQEGSHDVSENQPWTLLHR